MTQQKLSERIGFLQVNDFKTEIRIISQNDLEELKQLEDEVETLNQALDDAVKLTNVLSHQLTQEQKARMKNYE